MRNKLLKNLALFIGRKPWWSALILLVFTIIMGGFAEQLELTTSFTNLLPKNEPMVDEFDMIIEEYDGASSMLIVAEGHPDSLALFAEMLVPEIESYKEWVSKVDYKLPKEFFEQHGLMLMKSKDLENNNELFLSPNLDEFLYNLNNSLEKEYIASDEQISGREQEQGAVRFLDGVQTWIDMLDGTIEGTIDNGGALAADGILFGDEYYRSWDRQMMILQILPTFTMFDIEESVASTDAIEKIVHNYGEMFSVQAGLTGTIPLARDEMVAVQNDSMTITMLALIGILILFILAFRMIISPFLAIITLIIGVLWALGLAWPLVGTLNLMTSMMAVVLIGLGIDFSVHIISTFTEMRHGGKDVQEALQETFLKSGPGIITGGLTTASAFFTLLVSKTDGMREFGIVLGVGILMTMFAAMLVLPTLLVLRERIGLRIRKQSGPKKIRDIRYQFLGNLSSNFASYWKAGFFVIIILVIFLGFRGSKITMDYNYLNMEPKGLESIALQDRLIEVFDISSDYALITAESLDEASVITDRANDMPSAGSVQSIVDFLPPPDEQRHRADLVETIHRAMYASRIKLGSELDHDQILDELFRLEANVIEMQDMAYIGGQDKVYLKSALLVGAFPNTDDPSLTPLNDDLKRVMPDISVGLLSSFLQKFENQNNNVIDQIESFHNTFAQSYKTAVLNMSNSEEITVDDLPDGIRRQYVAKSGKNFLVIVFPKRNVWEINYLKQFSADLYAVNERATGLPPIFNRLMDEIGRDGAQATKIALAVIFLILLLDFRRLGKALLAIIPLVFGVVWMVGVMEFSGLQLTLLNIMAIPMIIGIGIDDGVHIVHRYNLEGWGAHRPVFASTGRAIFLTSITTMVGFGSLWFATYRGLGSMGIALFIGVGTCFLASLIVIPVFVAMFTSRKKK
ncbi:RND family transporter [Candidatus Neomarinimicrobiota bacterium]